jgi:hypothetical protein
MHDFIIVLDVQKKKKPSVGRLSIVHQFSIRFQSSFFLNPKLKIAYFHFKWKSTL